MREDGESIIGDCKNPLCELQRESLGESFLIVSGWAKLFDIR